MKFIYHFVTIMTINITIANDCYAGFFDQINKKAQEIQSKVDAFNREVVPSTEIQPKEHEGDTVSSAKQAPKVSASQQQDNNKDITVTGVATGVGLVNGIMILDKPTAHRYGAIEFHLTNVASSESTNTCSKYVLEKYYEYSSAELSQALRALEERVRTRPNVKLTGIKNTKSTNYCLFSDIEYLNAEKPPQSSSSQPNTSKSLKSKTTLLSVFGADNISGRLLSSVTSRLIDKKGLKIQYGDSLPGDFHSYCHVNSNTYLFYRNPGIANKNKTVRVPRRGSNVILTNVIYADKKCYFDEILLDQSTAKGISPTKKKEDIKSVTKSNNASTGIASQNNSNLKKTKHFGKKYTPNDALKSSVEGYMLIGTVNPEITMIERDYSTPRGAAKKKLPMFTMSNLVIPTSTNYHCKSYVQDNALLQYGDMTGTIKKAIGYRNYLTHIRPSDMEGICLYREIGIVDPEFDMSARLTQSDVVSTTPALIKEKAEVLNRCKGNLQMSTIHRCGCYADKYVQARKLFPDKDRSYAENIIQNECVNVTGFTKSKHKECLKSMTPGSKILKSFSKEDFCTCYAIEIENILLDTSISNRNQTSNILLKASSSCKYE